MPLKKQKAVLDLGRKIVEELNLDPGTDTLSRWMAHHLADLIVDIDTTKGDDKEEKQAYCVELILKLWDRRYQLADGSRPFEDFEPILRTLDTLDTTYRKLRHYNRPWELAREEKEDSTVKDLMQIVEGIDYSAKILIKSALVQAAEQAVDKKLEWVKLIEDVEKNSAEVAIIRFVNKEGKLFDQIDSDERAKKEIQDRVERLNVLIGMTQRYFDSLKGILVELDNR